MAFLRVLQQEEYILQNIEPPNRCNVLSLGPQNEKVRERARGKKDESSVVPFGTFYRMKCPLEDSITLKLYCVL